MTATPTPAPTDTSPAAPHVPGHGNETLKNLGKTLIVNPIKWTFGFIGKRIAGVLGFGIKAASIPIGGAIDLGKGALNVGKAALEGGKNVVVGAGQRGLDTLKMAGYTLGIQQTMKWVRKHVDEAGVLANTGGSSSKHKEEAAVHA